MKLLEGNFSPSRSPFTPLAGCSFCEGCLHFWCPRTRLALKSGCAANLRGELQEVVRGHRMVGRSVVKFRSNGIEKGATHSRPAPPNSPSYPPLFSSDSLLLLTFEQKTLLFRVWIWLFPGVVPLWPTRSPSLTENANDLFARGKQNLRRELDCFGIRYQT